MGDSDERKIVAALLDERGRPLVEKDEKVDRKQVPSWYILRGRRDSTSLLGYRGVSSSFRPRIRELAAGGRLL